MDKWMKDHNTCPICRADLIKYTSVPKRMATIAVPMYLIAASAAIVSTFDSSEFKSPWSYIITYFAALAAIAGFAYFIVVLRIILVRAEHRYDIHDIV